MIHWHHLAGFIAVCAFLLGIAGYLGAGMASRATTAADYRFPNRCMAFAALLLLVIWQT